MANPRKPFDVTLSADAERELTLRLCEAIRQAVIGRGDTITDNGDIDFAYSLYEQRSQKGITRDTPRYGGADLTSPIGTQMVDALTARTTKTVFVEPFWIVEGAGDDQKKAPAVEEFQHWRFEDMRGQALVAQAIRQAYIEEGSIIEVCEDSVPIKRMQVIRAKIATAPDGTRMLDEKTGKPMPEYDEMGEPVPAEGQDEFVEIKRTIDDYLRRGASLRTHSMKDFLFIPGHARDRRDVWAHAWRTWMSVGDLKRAEKRGEYANVDDLGTSMEREQRAEDDRQGLSVTVDMGSDQTQKELWNIQFYADIGKGFCCYKATVSIVHDVLLKLKADWLGRYRTVYVNPFPRTYSVYGQSLILHKLLTTIEEHTAWRNMNADRATLKANAPLKRLHGAQWDPRIQPFGAGQVIDVGDMKEIQPFEFEDVSVGALTKERDCMEDAVRIVGLNDIVTGLNPKLTRTLGENEMVTEQSLVRIEDPVRNIQEAFEELGELIHAIEVKTLEDMEAEQAEQAGGEMPDQGGMAAPASVAQSVKLRMGKDAEDFQGRFTSQMLSGKFRFKPRGSVESADPNKRINQFTNALGIMMELSKVNPMLMQRYTSPQVADALNQWFVDVVKIRDKQAFLAPLPPPPMMPGMMPGMPMPGGAPPGAPGPPMAGGPPGQGPSPQFGEHVLQQVLAGMPQGQGRPS